MAIRHSMQELKKSVNQKIHCACTLILDILLEFDDHLENRNRFLA